MARCRRGVRRDPRRAVVGAGGRGGGAGVTRCAGSRRAGRRVRGDAVGPRRAADGILAAGHVDAIAREVARLHEPARAALLGEADALVDVAAGTSVDRFERHVRDLARRLEGDGLAAAERLRGQRSLRRWTDRETGMCHTHLTLDPEADARLSAVVDAAARAKPDTGRSFEQLRADAFVAVVTS